MLDRENWGGKTGSGGPASQEQQNLDRKERLRKLVTESVDLSKDPYFMRNYLGQFECRLCLTQHRNEANYLAHTQGKRHQENLAKRSYQQSKDQQIFPTQQAQVDKPKKKAMMTPEYRIYKTKDPATKHYTLKIEIEYRDIAEGIQPRYRIMSSYEQKVEPVDSRYQYLVFAAHPYDTIAIKIPNYEIERKDANPSFSMGDDKIFTFTISFSTPKNFPSQTPR
ncbi:putative Splicing factor 3A subunit 2 [Blattamonas nauphoetae]|uniref:Splicing factor 3A subunit 2 n=1 Tax=Blattamonas nauphoetae TaxID=2049346 RepID=A0ABQ9YKY0_9EUKA|nr:putative Splicing factor 3A subunit 2 [Blattamonas nauphoetae]